MPGIPASRAAAGQPSSSGSGGHAHHCREEALAASSLLSLWHDGALMCPSGGDAGAWAAPLLPCCLLPGQQHSPGARDPALLCPAGNQSLVGTGRELSVFLGVFGTCLGLSGVSACLSSVRLSLAFGAWEQAAICSPRELSVPLPLG